VGYTGLTSSVMLTCTIESGSCQVTRLRCSSAAVPRQLLTCTSSSGSDNKGRFQYTHIMAFWKPQYYVVPIIAFLVYTGLRGVWRNLLRAWLHFQLNQIWRQEHEEAEPDEMFAAVSTEGRSLRRLQNATVASQPLTEHQDLGIYDALPGHNSQPPPPTSNQPPIPLLPYPRGSVSRSALNTGEPGQTL
jgi:hypothetical protein